MRHNTHEAPISRWKKYLGAKGCLPRPRQTTASHFDVHPHSSEWPECFIYSFHVALLKPELSHP